MYNWSPRQIVDELDRYIIAQNDAKRAVAIALRNRYRRSKLSAEMRDEITPKNIIMIGPTGCGKTEIARRLAKLVEAPFVKVEATKFTEVGYVGRDVESIIRDLVEASIRLVKGRQQEKVKPMADALAEQRLIKVLVPIKKKEQRAQQQNPFEMLFGGNQQSEEIMTEEEKSVYANKRDEVEAQLRAGVLEDTIIEVEVEETPKLGMDMGGMGVDINMGEVFGNMLPKRKKKRKMKVSDARKMMIAEESDKLIDMDDVISEAIERAEQDGIVFIDEIDKIAGKSMNGPDVSREGVQRDILPIVEGSTVTTKYGPVRTDYILFIAAGAFHVSSVTDLIPELQGRFPITVELKGLTKQDFVKILHNTDNAITKQYAALLEVDNIDLTFADDALDAIAEYAFLANEMNENIGARRLHTVMELLLKDISFNASGQHPMIKVNVDSKYVQERLSDQIQKRSMQKYII